MKKLLVLLCLLFLISTVFSLSATRSFNSPATADNNLTVTLTVIVDQTSGTAYGIEETFPSNFTLTDSGTAIIYQNTLKWIDYNALQGTYTYTYKIKAPLTAGTYTITGISQFEGQASTTINGNTSITVIANCTESDWTHTDKACQSNNTLTRTWSKMGTCTDGANHPTTESISCNYNAPTCTDFNYVLWSACTPNETQNRTITSSLPIGCEGGNPTLVRQCTYIPPCTEDNWTYELNPQQCPDNNTQIKTWTKIGNCSTGTSHPASETITCNHALQECTAINYSQWGNCAQNGTQTRTITNKTPDGCTQNNPTLTQECTYTPLTSTKQCTNFTYSQWSTCSSTGTQTRSILTSSPNGCTGGNLSELTKTCTPEITKTCTENDWNQTIEPATCPQNGSQVITWTKTTDCTGGIQHDEFEEVDCSQHALWNPITDFINAILRFFGLIK